MGNKKKNYIVGLLLAVVCVCVVGCNFGHPKKTNKPVNESDLIGTWAYRSELEVILGLDGQGTQSFDGKIYKFKWKITTDNYVVLDSLHYKFGDEVEVEKFKFIISDDYRDHFYFFGGTADFDNYEIWQKK